MGEIYGYHIAMLNTNIPAPLYKKMEGGIESLQRNLSGNMPRYVIKMITYIFFNWVCSEFSSKNIKYLFSHPSSFGESGECEVVWVHLSQT